LRATDALDYETYKSYYWYATEFSERKVGRVTMTSMPISVARDELSEIVNRVAYAKERICLTRHGKGVACVVSIEEARLLDLIEDRLDISDALAAMQEMRVQGPVSWADLKAELGV
jgi:prevent-host-death family protein